MENAKEMLRAIPPGGGGALLLGKHTKGKVLRACTRKGTVFEWQKCTK